MNTGNNVHVSHIFFFLTFKGCIYHSNVSRKIHYNVILKIISASVDSLKQFATITRHDMQHSLGSKSLS